MSFQDSAKKVNSAQHPEDIFPDKNEVKNIFRKLSEVLHPDKNGNSLESETAFKNLNKLHQQVLEKIKLGTYGKKVLATVKTKKSTYEVVEKIKSGSICDVFSTSKSDVVLKIPRNPKSKDFMLNEQKTLSFIRNESPVKDLKVLAHIPELLDSFELNISGTKKQVNVLKNLSGYFTLEEARAKYPNGVDMRTAAWIWNRILGSFLAVHQAGFVHTAVIPDNFLICPKDHNGVLIDFCYAVKPNLQAKAVNPKWQSFYPQEVTDKSKLNSSTDIYMSAMCIIYILGGNPETKEIPKNIPIAIQGLLRYCLLSKTKRPQDAFELHSEFNGILKQIYGEPKFHPFTM